MPSATTLVRASPTAPPVSVTPAFASAKSGRITKLDHGSRACSTRASGETASRESQASRSQDVASASGGSGSSTVSSAIRCASSLTVAGRWNGCAGVNRPIATPAIVGWIPARYVAYQSATPSKR